MAVGCEGVDCGRELLRAGDRLLGRAAPWHEPIALFTWRRQLRKQMESQGAVVPAFVPAVVDTGSAAEPAPPIQRPKKGRRSKASAVELEIDGVAVKISRGADAVVIAAVIEALRATR